MNTPTPTNILCGPHVSTSGGYPSEIAIKFSFSGTGSTTFTITPYTSTDNVTFTEQTAITSTLSTFTNIYVRYNSNKVNLQYYKFKVKAKTDSNGNTSATSNFSNTFVYNDQIYYVTSGAGSRAEGASANYPYTSIDFPPYVGIGTSLTSLLSPSYMFNVTGGGSNPSVLKVTRITMPDSVNSIDNFLFKGMANLTSCNMPASITFINANEAFSETALSVVDFTPSTLLTGIQYSYNSMKKINKIVVSAATTTLTNSFTTLGTPLVTDTTKLGPLDVYFLGNIPTTLTGGVFGGVSNKLFRPCTAYYLPGTNYSSLQTYKANASQTDFTFSQFVAWVPSPTLTLVTNYFENQTTQGIYLSLSSVVASTTYSVKIYRSDVTPYTETNIDFTIPSAKTYNVILTASNTSNFLQEGGVYQFSVITKISGISSTESSISNTFSYNSYTNYAVNSGTTTAKVTGFYNGITALSPPSNINISGSLYTVTNISPSAFLNATTLTSITIPNTISDIPESAFNGCSNLTTINFTAPSSLSSIGASAFNNCSKLLSITIPSSVTSIGASSFSGCSSLTSINIPPITSIGASTFSGCSALTSITIPSSVTSIGESAFSGCNGLTSITIPSSVTSIDITAFTGCISLASITVDAANLTYSSLGGVLFNKSGSTLLFYPSAKIDSSYIIPTSPSCTSIADYAFMNNTNTSALTDITFSNVTSIGNYVFNFTKLKGYFFVSIPSFSTNTFVDGKRGSSAFTIDTTTNPNSVNLSSYFNSVSNIVAPTNVGLVLYAPASGIAPSGLYASWIFTPIALSSYVVTISNGSIERNTNITDMNATYMVLTDFNGLPLSDNTNYKVKIVITLTNGLILSSSYTSLFLFSNKVIYSILSGTDASVSGYNNAPTIINIMQTIRIDQTNYTIKKISDSAFLGCNTATTINFPPSNTINSFGQYAFKNCTLLSNISIPTTITSIGAFAFDGCNTLTTISLPSSLNTIGNGALGNCSSLTSIVLGGANANFSVEGGILYNVNKSTLIQYPAGIVSTSPTLLASVTRLGSYCFYGCKNITSFTIPSNITTIGDGPFTSCSNLTQFFLGSGTTLYFVEGGVLFNANKTTLIQYGAGLTNTTYSIPNTVITIANASFQNIVNLTILSIPTSVTTIGDNAFNNLDIALLEIPYSVKTFGVNAYNIKLGGVIKFLSGISITYNLASLNLDISSPIAIFSDNINTADVTIDIDIAASAINDTFLFKPFIYYSNNTVTPFALENTKFKISESANIASIFPSATSCVVTSALLTNTSFSPNIANDFLAYICSSLNKPTSAIYSVQSLSTYTISLHNLIDTNIQNVLLTQQAAGEVAYVLNSTNIAQIFLDQIMLYDRRRTYNMAVETPVDGWYKNLTQKGDKINFIISIYPAQGQGVALPRTYLFNITLT
jgi:hypothetical protein